MTGEKRQITRTRTSYSCQTCRRRKVKCDKTHPTCTACQKVNEECVYLDEKTSPDTQEDSPAKRQKHNRDGQVAINPHGLAVAEQQLIDLTHLLQNRHKVPSLAPTNPYSNSSKYPRDSSERQVDDRSTPMRGSARVDHERQSGTDHETDGRALVDHTNGSQKAIDSREANLTLNRITDALIFLNQSLRTDPRTSVPQLSKNIDSRQHQTLAVDDAAQVRGSVQYKSDVLEDMATLVPTDEQSNVLFRVWLTSVYSVLPIVDPFDTLRKYEAFHRWYRHDLDKGVPDPAPETRPLIIAIYYAGGLSLSERGMKRWFNKLARRPVLAAFRMHFVKIMNEPRMQSKETIAAKIMMRYICPEHLDNVMSGTHLASIIRSAESLGLHRGSTLGLTPYHREVQQRLWMEIVNLDASLASSSGLPPMLNELYYESSFPSDLKDDYVGTARGRDYEKSTQNKTRQPMAPDDPDGFDRSSMASVHNLVSQARSIIASCTNKLSALSIRAKPTSRDDLIDIRRILRHLDESINNIIERIVVDEEARPDTMPAVDKRGQSLAMDHCTIMAQPVDAIQIGYLIGRDPIIQVSNMPFINDIRLATKRYHRWARLLLSMLLDQVHCYSCGPFLRYAKTRLWQMARSAILRHSHSYLRKIVIFAKDLEFEHLRWTVMPLLQPMHVAAPLLVDLYEEPHSREAATSRALIDAMLSLGDPLYGLVGGDYGLTFYAPLEEGGPTARMLMRQLRFKAWQKAGLDPALLWTEEDQVRVGVAVPLTEAEKASQDATENALGIDVVGNINNNAFVCQYHRRAEGDLSGRQYSPVGQTPSSTRTGGDESNRGDDRPTHRLLRARPDQPVVPFYMTQMTAESWHNVPKGRNQAFEGINELIEKIKSSRLPPNGNRMELSSNSKDPANAPQQPSPSVVGNLRPSEVGNGQRIRRVSRPGSMPDAMTYHWHGLVDGPPSSEWAGSTVNEVRSDTEDVSHSRNTTSPSDQHQATVLASPSNVPIQPDYNFDFDWSNWDAVFGQVDCSNLYHFEDQSADWMAGIFNENG